MLRSLDIPLLPPLGHAALYSGLLRAVRARRSKYRCYPTHQTLSRSRIGGIRARCNRAAHPVHGPSKTSKGEEKQTVYQLRDQSEAVQSEAVQ